MRVRRQQQPYWLWSHKLREAKLDLILKLLQVSTDDQITAKKAQFYGIQLTPLDFHTGDTSPSVTPCFAPRDDDHILIKKRRWMLEKSTFFRCFLGQGANCQNKTVRQRDGLLRSALITAFKDYRTIATRIRNVVPDLLSIDNDNSLDGLIHHNGEKAKFRLLTAHRLRSKNHRIRQNHQIITISPNEYSDTLPSITELQVLVTMMRQAMVNERKLGHFSDCRMRHWQERMPKYVFPTLVTTIYRGGYVRVIYGYMDDSLKIQYTEPQQVTTENFEPMMERLLQWNMAETQGDPTRVVTLPPILEEEGEDPTVPPTTTPKAMQSNNQQPIHIMHACHKQRYSKPYLYESFTRSGVGRSKFHNCAFNSCALRKPRKSTKTKENIDS
ncbi:uncharacterized protein N7498_010075 [Penicillium cinerascens]|uniref:Uncharacterized protein n=1 Tax=Penicillium cinerascens TaxID=70096 RepID=A0A9W9J683_9EURO|nr:uncharacterized protein N7498_010075 [Penicillium cinerascens]KAJ5191090.1 hypothetical protein N7498_010075 [Penicillium cinerascens]